MIKYRNVRNKNKNNWDKSKNKFEVDMLVQFPSLVAIQLQKKKINKNFFCENLTILFTVL